MTFFILLYLLLPGFITSVIFVKMKTARHIYKDFILEYIVFGGGAESLLCFHGFSRSANDFLLFKNAWGKKYTIYSFNFFHHGNSVYPVSRIDRNTLTSNEWSEIISDFLIYNKINDFSLAGYSMGGKLSLSLFLFFKDRVKKIYLFAPDGLKENFWYRFTSRNILGNKLYRNIIHKPDFFFFVLKFIKNIGLLNDKLYRFVMHNLENKEKRILVYNVWMTMRHIRPNKHDVLKYLNETNTLIELYFGLYDKVIPAKLGEKFKNKCPQKIKLSIIECGHNLFNENTYRALIG